MQGLKNQATKDRNQGCYQIQPCLHDEIIQQDCTRLDYTRNPKTPNHCCEMEWPPSTKEKFWMNIWKTDT